MNSLQIMGMLLLILREKKIIHFEANNFYFNKIVYYIVYTKECIELCVNIFTMRFCFSSLDIIPLYSNFWRTFDDTIMLDLMSCAQRSKALISLWSIAYLLSTYKKLSRYIKRHNNLCNYYMGHFNLNAHTKALIDPF